MQLDFLQKNCHASHWNHYAWKCIMLRKWEITLQLIRLFLKTLAQKLQYTLHELHLFLLFCRKKKS